MVTYKVQSRQSGDVIETNLTLEEAKNLIVEYETEDMVNEDFSYNFYEIMEED